jgi:calcineurin-like phosphoesterase family protein
MNEALVTNHNMFVKPQDHWTCLGDLTLFRSGRLNREAFIKLIRSMNGHKRLVLGNHDHWPPQVYLDAGFEKIYGTWRTDEGILLSHVPVHPSSMGTAIANVHGHIHNHQGNMFKPVIQQDDKQQLYIKPYVNISLEVTDYRPLSLEEVKERINAAVSPSKK